MLVPERESESPYNCSGCGRTYSSDGRPTPMLLQCGHSVCEVHRATLSVPLLSQHSRADVFPLYSVPTPLSP